MDKLCEVAVSYRPNLKNGRHPKVTCASDVVKLKWEIFSRDEIEYREIFAVILLNVRSRVLGVARICEGTTTNVTVDAKMVFQRALLANAASIILVHNHPSGSVSPSPSDDKLTEKLFNGAKLLDIRVCDHVILTEGDDYYSYVDNNRLIHLGV